MTFFVDTNFCFIIKCVVLRRYRTTKESYALQVETVIIQI